MITFNPGAIPLAAAGLLFGVFAFLNRESAVRFFDRRYASPARRGEDHPLVRWWCVFLLLVGVTLAALALFTTVFNNK